MSRVMPTDDPTYSESWRQWCLALSLLRHPKAERQETLAKLTDAARAELEKRLMHIHKFKTIPVAEFLP